MAKKTRVLEVKEKYDYEHNQKEGRNLHFRAHIREKTLARLERAKLASRLSWTEFFNDYLDYLEREE